MAISFGLAAAGPKVTQFHLGRRLRLENKDFPRRKREFQRLAGLGLVLADRRELLPGRAEHVAPRRGRPGARRPAGDRRANSAGLPRRVAQGQDSHARRPGGESVDLALARVAADAVAVDQHVGVALDPAESPRRPRPTRPASSSLAVTKNSWSCVPEAAAMWMSSTRSWMSVPSSAARLSRAHITLWNLSELNG